MSKANSDERSGVSEMETVNVPYITLNRGHEGGSIAWRYDGVEGGTQGFNGAYVRWETCFNISGYSNQFLVRTNGEEDNCRWLGVKAQFGIQSVSCWNSPLKGECE